MAYNPPPILSADFALESGYVAPSNLNTNFNLGSTITIDYVDCLLHPFTITSTLSPDFIPQVQIPLIALESVVSLEASLLWYSSVQPLDSTSEIGIPDLLITLVVPPFTQTNTLTGTNQLRVKLVALNGNSSLAITNIIVAQAGYEIVSPWPFESVNNLGIPDIEHTLKVPVFTLNNTLSTPLIVVGETAVVYIDPFISISGLSSNIGNQLYIPGFSTISNFVLDFIKVMPEGDQYIGTPPFIMVNELVKPLIQSGFLIPAFDSVNNLSVESIFSGISLEVEPFVLSSSFISTLEFDIFAKPLEISSQLAASVSIDLWIPPFELTSILDVSIYSGTFVVLEPFKESLTLTAKVSFVLGVQPFISTSMIGIPAISRFVLVPEFENTSSLSVGNIFIFTIDLANVFYFFNLTGAENGLEDIEIPISSFQCRMRSGEPTYLQVVIPGVSHAIDIKNRPSGTLQVSMGYKIKNEIVRKRVIVSSDFETIRIDEGTESKSITLSGHKTETFIQKEITLKGSVYKNTTGSNFRYRIAEPNIELNAGDIVTIDEETFIADLISYYVKATKNGVEQNMEIAQL